MARRRGEERRRFWKAHVEAWRRSGLSQAEYCRRQGLGASSLRYWRKKLDGSGDGAPEGVAVKLVAVRVSEGPQAPPGAWGAEGARSGVDLAVVVGGRYRIEVGDGFRAQTLERLVATLEARR